MPPTNWYVNLNASYGEKNKTNVGETIALVATRKFGHNFKREGGREVSWTLVPSTTNAGDLEYVLAPGGLDHATTRERGNGEFHNTLRVPTLGGRTYTVTARKTSGAASGATGNVTFTKEYVIWRRIYYSVHTMNPHCRTLFESVEQQIKDVFARVHIELKRRNINSCIVNEPVTRRGTDSLLAHTYAGPALDRSPHHLRVVIVRDLATSLGFDVHWTMDEHTAPIAGKQIGIGSQGPNHSVIVYTNTLASIDLANPLHATERLQVYVHTAPVAVPNGCVARNTDHQLTVDFTADATTVPIGNAIAGGNKANFTARVTGIRCDAGFQAGNDHPIQATISRATLEANPVIVRSARVWVAADGTAAHIRDPNIILANPGAADQLRVTLADGTAVDLLVGDIGRQDDHTLRISLTSDPRVRDAVATNAAVRLEIRRHGVLGLGPITPTDNYDFDWREFQHNTRATTRRRVDLAVRAGGQGVQITTPWLWLAPLNPLTMTIETLGLPVHIPRGAVNVITPQRLEIDLGANLGADLSLQPAALAIANHRKLTFAGKLQGLHAIGGSTDSRYRYFIGLSARKLTAGESDADTARRLKLGFCHELGHALGLGWQTARNHTHARDDANPQYYTTGYGGLGPHCNYNAHLQPSGADHGRESTSTGEIYVHAGGGPLCIMFHSIGNSNMGDDFCDLCKAHLRRVPVRFG